MASEGIPRSPYSPEPLLSCSTTAGTVRGPGTGQRASAFMQRRETSDMSHSSARRFRQLAADALAEATLLTDPKSKRLLIEIAASYERLAESAEAREAATPPADRKG